MEELDQVLQDEPHIFLLNNLLMAVQFFDNYDRDVEILRQNWYKELSLESHANKCFYADSLLRLVSANVNFSPLRGSAYNTLNSSRIYITTDNVEAAFDPSTMSSTSENSHYKFTLSTDEESEKTGYVSLVQSKKLKAQSLMSKFKTRRFAPNSIQGEKQHHSHHFKTKVSFDENLKVPRKAGINEKPKFVTDSKLSIPAQGFSKNNSEAKNTWNAVQNSRANERTEAEDRIPSRCFQTVAQNTVPRRRTGLDDRLKDQVLLNSTAYKGYFHDLLIERLWKPLGLDLEAAKRAETVGEFVKVTQAGAQYRIAASVPVRDWKFHLKINKRLGERDKRRRFAWPCRGMLDILNILPCSAVPDDRSDSTGDKNWKLCFPKAEEMLTLHMMHAQVKCYLLVLILYKCFLETQINETSLGPTHLLHLLFWKVHKNFTAWPEDRPAEILIGYLKALYRKLQNKHLPDFFVSSRNLFADSVPMELRRAQVIIKQILERPVAHVAAAVQHLDFHPKFYPVLDVAEIITELKKHKENKAQKRVKDGRTSKTHKNDEEDEEKGKAAVDADIDAKLRFNLKDAEKCGAICEKFVFHYMRVAQESMKRDSVGQALFYLEQTQRVFRHMRRKGLNPNTEKTTGEQIEKVKELCGMAEKRSLANAKGCRERNKQSEENESKDAKASGSDQIIRVKL